MPDKRVPRPGGRATTPGGENTEYPLNNGGVMNYKEDKKEQDEAYHRLLDETADENSCNNDDNNVEYENDYDYDNYDDYDEDDDDEDDEDNDNDDDSFSEQSSSGFGVKPMTDILSQEQEIMSEMSGADKFLVMSYQDVLDFICGENELEELIKFIRNNEEYSFNPPTRDEFGQMLKFAISRKTGKIDSKDIPSAETRAASRELVSPGSKKEYADPINKAFPIDTEARIKTAHAYIHKYWNSPSKRGVTATYGKADFVAVHKKIVAAMKKNNIEHNYLDSLDDASGFHKKVNKEKKVTSSMEPCNEHKQVPCQHNSAPLVTESEGVGLFSLKVGQQVVSFSRGGISSPGEIVKIDGAIANVQWSSGLVTTELLVGLVPNI